MLVSIQAAEPAGVSARKEALQVTCTCNCGCRLVVPSEIRLRCVRCKQLVGKECCVYQEAPVICDQCEAELSYDPNQMTSERAVTD